MENKTHCDAGYYAARFSIPDYLVCISTLMVSAVIGVYYAIQARKSVASTSDVLMGGRAMATFPMAMSLIARYLNNFQTFTK
jgi:sodium-coupled monocarboxylate transporter 8/12